MSTPAYRSRPRGVSMLFGSTIGKKVIMGVTGLMMVGWLVMHMAGNTLIYAGDHQIAWAGMSAMDFYGWMIQEGSHGFIWVMRAVMLGAIVLHVWSAVSLTMTNNAARPNRYAKSLKKQKTTFMAMYMRVGGFAILAFIIFHILHLTVGLHVLHPTFEHGAVLNNVIAGLSNPVFAAIYIAANLFVGFHLYHGIWSGLQTLGFNHPRYNNHRRLLSLGVAALVAGVNISFPIAVLSGVVS